MLPASAPARLVKIAVVLAMSLVLTGCGKSKITKENYDQIKNDMTLEDVEAILGKGTQTGGDGSLVGAQVGVDVTGGARPPSTVEYVWESGKNSITVTFRRDKVVGKRSVGF
jgi:major membrane immunogen (membrane-anchored lipoprotein)